VDVRCGADRDDVQLARHRPCPHQLPEPARLRRRTGDRHGLRVDRRGDQPGDRRRDRADRPTGEVLVTSEFMAPSTSPTVAPTAPRRGRFIALRRALAPVGEARGLPKWVLYIGLAMVAVFVVFAIFAPWISPYRFDQYLGGHGHRFPKSGHPSGAHWFGTNIMSTDVFSHIVYGSRTALEVIAIAVVISMLIGVPLGLFSGYYGGPLD